MSTQLQERREKNKEKEEEMMHFSMHPGVYSLTAWDFHPNGIKLGGKKRLKIQQRGYFSP